MFTKLAVAVTLLAAGCSTQPVPATPPSACPDGSAAAEPTVEPPAATPTPSAGVVTPREAGAVVSATTAPTHVAASGKAWITRLARSSSAFVGILKLAPGAAVPEHRDAAAEYIYVLSGSGKLTMDGTVHDIGPSTLVFMPPGVVVSYQNGGEELVALQVFAGPEPAEKYDSWKAIEPSK